jgi:hypothetical protein
LFKTAFSAIKVCGGVTPVWQTAWDWLQKSTFRTQTLPFLFLLILGCFSRYFYELYYFKLLKIFVYYWNWSGHCLLSYQTNFNELTKPTQA